MRVYFNRVFSLLCIIYKGILLKIVAKQKSIVVLAQFTPQTGTHTYFKQVIAFFCEEQLAVTVLTHSSNQTAILQLQATYSFNVIYYTNELDFFEYFGKVDTSSVFYLMDKFLPKLLFLLKVMYKAKSQQIWISSQIPTQFLFSFLLPIRVNYVVHAILWGNIDAVNGFFVTRIINKRNKKIITVSPPAASAANRFWNYPLSQIYIIPNFYTPNDTANSINIDCTKRDILCIGTLDDNKQPFLFIQLAKLSFEELGTHYQFVWLGDGPLLPACTKAALDLPNLSFIGKVDNPDYYYEGVKLYLQLSKAESHGIAILGAMFHEVVCLVTRSGGPESMIIENETGYLIDIDEKAEQIWAKMKSILNSNQEIVKVKAKTYQASHFSETIWKQHMRTML